MAPELIAPAPLSFTSDSDSPLLASSAPLSVVHGASNVSQTANPILGGFPSSGPSGVELGAPHVQAEAPSSSGVTLSPPSSLERPSRIAEVSCPSKSASPLPSSTSIVSSSPVALRFHSAPWPNQN
ncbi:hypothetical protein Nepgr_006755 [Nepenthes gracilis]|uniref:Uncharacterized protein n=1 Tax=Nepenthes gracilis TaxID=150966 RepID=A0AAD3S5Q4_NEPGR|nr:hypothetical protein Nepgr_006755 [Nepenthes gracilis]